MKWKTKTQFKWKQKNQTKKQNKLNWIATCDSQAQMKLRIRTFLKSKWSLEPPRSIEKILVDHSVQRNRIESRILFIRIEVKARVKSKSKSKPQRRAQALANEKWTIVKFVSTLFDSIRFAQLKSCIIIAKCEVQWRILVNGEKSVRAMRPYRTHHSIRCKN